MSVISMQINVRKDDLSSSVFLQIHHLLEMLNLIHLPSYHSVFKIKTYALTATVVSTNVFI